MRKTESFKIGKIINSVVEYEKDSNVPTYITEYKCVCGNGKISHYRVPGFDDNFFRIECKICNQKYDYIEQIGNEFELYFKK